MRPQIVLPLVLVAVVSLIAALYLISSQKNGDRRELAGVAAPQTTAPQGPAEPGPALREQPAAQTQPRERSQVDAGAAREAVPTNARGALANLLRVRVLDPDGNPVAGAKVELTNEAGLPGIAALMQATQHVHGMSRSQQQHTAKDGVAVFANLDPDAYAASVEVEGYARVERGGISIGDETQTEAVLQLTPGYSVQGFVTDMGNAAIPGAKVLVVSNLFAHLPGDEPFRRGRVVEADATGLYRAEHLARGMYMVLAHAEGFGRKQVLNLQVPGPRDEAAPVEQDFKLEPGFAIAGRVVSTDNRPIPGARVQVFSYQTNDSSRGDTLTGDDGRFQIPDLARGSYALMASAQGWAEARMQRIEAGRTDILVEMQEQGGVMGRVTADGAPVQRFSVAVRQINLQTRQHGRPIRPPATVQHAEGHFKVGGLDNGSYVVEIVAPGFAQCFSEPFEVVHGEITPNVVVALSRGGALTGRVVDARSGEPIAGARVQTQDNTFQDSALTAMWQAFTVRNTTDRSGRTDADGRFRLELLTPELYQLVVDHPNYVRTYLRDLRIEASDEPTDAGVIGMGRGAVLEGAVFDSSGVAVIGAEIAVSGMTEANTRHYKVSTDSRGRYRIENVAPGSYTVSATRNRPGDPFSVLIDMQKTRADIDLIEGREHQHNFTLDN